MRSTPHPPQYVMWYVHWAGPFSAPDVGALDAVRAAGATPVITWMSNDPGKPASLALTTSRIASGDADPYIRAWAAALTRVPGTVLLRFDPEMNGNWFPWSPAGDPAATLAYVQAWRHVHDIFAAAGASNVQWVWSPNVQYPGSAPLADLYPGDAYVDWVGLDGYNWGPIDGHTWQTPAEVFGPSLRALDTVSRRPVMLSEVGTTADGGNKANWIKQFYSFLGSQNQVRAFVWFDADKETDWRFDDTAADLAAFEAGLNAVR
jgi:mannan endo-1,4-beta-mannosidase